MAIAETNVDVRVRSISEKKGFVEGAKGIDQLGKRANVAAPSMKTLDKATAGLGVSSSVAGSRVGGLTQAMLRGLGITTGMTEASIAAGTAVDALAGKMALLNAAVAGGALAVAVLVPVLIRWWNSSKRVKEEQLALRDSMLSMLDQLEKYVETVPFASKEMREFAEALRAAALLKQAEEIDKLEKSVIDLTHRQAALNKEIEFNSFLMKQGNINTERVGKRLAGMTEESRKLEIQLGFQLGKYNQLLVSQRNGVLLGERVAKGTADATAASAARAKALDVETKAQEALNDALAEGANFIDQAALARDSQALADLEAKRARGELTEEQFRALTMFDNEDRLLRETERDRQAFLRQERLDAIAQDTFLGAESLAAATAFFGTNKAARIAQALADTAAGATRAYAEIPPPANFAVAAAITAAGLANVAQIRKTELGFDNPLNDRLAESFGERFAVDMVQAVNSGFQRMLGRFGGGGGGTSVDRSMTFTGPISVGGQASVTGGSRTRILLALERELIAIRRTENRTRIPR